MEDGDSDESSEGGDGSDEEGSEGEDVSEEAEGDDVLRDKLANALKEAGLDAEAPEDDDEDEEESGSEGAEEVLLDDDQMFKLDERLSAIFREKKAAKADAKGMSFFLSWLPLNE
jgi:hypothetical protein